MYTDEDAAVHKKIMVALKKYVKHPRGWREFRKLQKEVASMRMKHLNQAVQNHQSSFEQMFVSALYGLQFKLVLIVNNGVTKRLKSEAKEALDQLCLVIDKIVALREVALKTSKEFILNVPQQRYWLERLKRSFKTKGRR